MHFTQEQLNAIDIARLGEDACIVAGPGSGKTTVLVERYRQLVASGIQPSEILAITFTEKAAANMRQRLASEFAGDSEMLRKLERAQVSTIHGFCSRLLKENATAAGVDPEFEVLDEQLAVLEQSKALRLALDDAFRLQPERAASLLEASTGADLEQMIPPLYDAMRAAGLRPHDLKNIPRLKAPSLEQVLAKAERYIREFPAPKSDPQKFGLANVKEWLTRVRAVRDQRELDQLLAAKPFNLRLTVCKDLATEAQKEIDALRTSLQDDLYADEKDMLLTIFEEFDANYRKSKSDLAALDFNDLEYFAVRVLEENPDIRKQVNEQYRLVMIDEFQDTSAQQSALVNLVRAPGRFYAVGDLNQSIYSFRHASPLVFNHYRRVVEESKAHGQELVENWRSREAILLATQTILHSAPGIEARDLIPARKLPPRDEPLIEVLAIDESEEAEETRVLEAQWVVNRIVDLRATLRLGDERRPAKLSDFAILLRKMTIVQPFLDALEAAGLDYNLNRRSGFFETREARDLLHLLRMIHNPRDEVSTLVVLRSAFAGVSDEGLLRLKRQHKNFGDALASAVPVTLDPEDQSRFDRFRSAFAGWREAAAHTSIDRLVLRALDESGIAWDARSAAGGNIEKFVAIARSYAQMTLGEFLLHVDAMRKANPRETDAPIDETRDAVQIMTTHAAKGLEFPVVILAAMETGVESDRDCLNFTPRFGLGVKWPSGGLVHAENLKRLEEIEKEEANRLLYVAMTRAEEHLILAWTQKSGKRPRLWAKTVSEAFGLADLLPGDEVRVRRFNAPDGKPFEVRIVRTASAPARADGAGVNRAVSDAIVIAPPSQRGQYEQNTTASALSQFASCPRKYYLGNYLGWNGDLVRPRGAESLPASPLRASDIGTQVHALLADVPVKQPDLEALRLARVFESSAYGKRSAKARARETEWDFCFALEDLILRGTIDLWFEDAQGLMLIDYKTDDVTSEQAADRARDYSLQIQIYALALTRALGKPPSRALLYFLRPDVSVSVPVNEAEENVSRVAREFTAAQEQLHFPLSVGAHCRRCEFYRNICPAKI